MESTNKFVDGLRVSKPSPKAATFVVAKLGIQVEAFTKYLEDNANANGYVDLDILISKNKPDSYYAVKNEWKPEQKPTADEPKDVINSEDIPF